MNRDEVTRLAEENGIVIVGEAMVRFANLAYAAGAAAEREEGEKNRLLVGQLQALVQAGNELIDDHKALLAKTLPALIRLGDFVGNVDEGGASGLGRIDRCALILEVKNAIRARGET